MQIATKDLAVTIDHQHIFSGVCLEASGGSMLALTGPSGSGKTTLLNCLGMILPATSGQILIDEVDVTGWKDSQRTKFWSEHAAFIYQDYGIIEDETVLYNTTLGVGNKSSDAKHILDHVGLAGRETTRASALSGGEKQRLGVARAIHKHADVIYADEPTASLDDANRDMVIGLLRERATAGALVLVATHDQHLVEQCDSHYVLQAR